MTNYNDGKWIGWNGGECPVHPETVVECVCVDRAYAAISKGMALKWTWDHADIPIIAFRVIKEHKDPREWWIDPVIQHVVSHKPNINTSAYIHVKEQQE